MRSLHVASLLCLAGCSALDVPPAETAYFRDQLARAQAAPAARPVNQEASVLREAAGKLELRAVAEAERIRRGDETEGLLDVEAEQAR